MNVQIDLQLLVKLWTYFYEIDNRTNAEQEMFTELDEKIDKLIARTLYTKYRRSATPEEREAARQEYLQHISK